MLQVVRRKVGWGVRGVGAEPPRVPTFPMRGGGGRGGEGRFPGGLFPTSCFIPPPFPFPSPPPSTGSARNPTPSSPQGFGGGGAFKSPRSPNAVLFCGAERGTDPSVFRGGSGRFWAAAGARCCPRGASPCPAGGPPPPRPPMPRTPECRGTRVGGAGLRRPRCLGGCSLMGGEPQSFPKAEGIAGGGERKELRTIFAGVGNGWSVVPSIYLRLSR